MSVTRFLDLVTHPRYQFFFIVLILMVVVTSACLGASIRDERVARQELMVTMLTDIDTTAAAAIFEKCMEGSQLQNAGSQEKEQTRHSCRRISLELTRHPRQDTPAPALGGVSL